MAGRGDGEHQIQPIHVENLADCAVAPGASANNSTVEAIGPETFTHREPVEAVGAATPANWRGGSTATAPLATCRGTDRPPKKKGGQTVDSCEKVGYSCLRV